MGVAETPYTIEDYKRETREWLVEQLTPEERLEELSPEQKRRLKSLLEKDSE